MNTKLRMLKENSLCIPFVLLFAFFMVSHLSLLWNSSILPYTDLPFRLAGASIVKNIGEATNHFSDYFSVDLSVRPNILHTLFCSLDIFPSIEVANKFYYSLCTVLFPLSVLFLLVRWKGNVWISLLSFLVLYHFSVLWGFSEFTLAVPIVLLMFLLMIETFEEGSIWGSIVLMLLFVLLFFLHVIALMFSLTVFGLCCLYYCKSSLKKILMKSFVIMPVLIVIVFWWKSDSSSLRTLDWENLLFYYKYSWLKNLLNERIDLPFFENPGLFSGAMGQMVSLFFFVFVLSPVLLIFFLRKKINLSENQKKRVIPVLIFLFCTLFFYIFIPHKISDTYYLFQRFSVFILISIILLSGILLRKIPGKIKNHVIIVICAVCSLHAILWYDYFDSFKKEAQKFDQGFLPPSGDGRTLGSLIYEPFFRGRPVFLHFANYYIVWNEGVASTCLVDYRYGIVKRKTCNNGNGLPPHRGVEWIGKKGAYDGRFSGMDVILVKGKLPDDHKGYFKSFPLAKSSGPWQLFKNENPGKKICGNGLGGDIINEAISGFKVNSFKPYVWTRIGIGKRLFTDRDYSYITSHPILDGHLTLCTSNGDKYEKSIETPFISFMARKDITVYVVYEANHTDIESLWLNSENGWKREPFKLKTSMKEKKSLRKVSSQNFPAGSHVHLWGNGCNQKNCDMYTIVLVPDKRSI